MIHDRIKIFENPRIEDARLPQGNPVLQARFSHLCLGDRFADCIVIVNTNLDRIARAAPVDGRIAVTRLGDGADIDELDRIRIGLCLDRTNDILNRADIGFHRALWEVIRRGGDHPAHMKDIICTGYAREHILIVCEIAPDELHARIVGIEFEFFPVFVATAVEQHQIEWIFSLIKLLEPGKPHIAGCTS